MAHGLRRSWLFSWIGRSDQSKGKDIQYIWGGEPLKPYDYTSLESPKHIRLIRMSRIDGLLACEITSTSLDQAPPYFALSYCWGKSSETVVVNCDGRALLISRNLCSGLMRIIAPESPIAKGSYLWVDQICINQKDLPEKSMQVQMMGQIYNSAIRTIVWLGQIHYKSSEECTKALSKLAAAIEQDLKESKAETGAKEIAHKLFSRGELETRLNLPPVSDPWWRSVTLLARLPWFKRAWVIQEVCFSREQPIVLLGNHSLKFKQLQLLAFWSYVRGLATALNVETLSFDTLDMASNICHGAASQWGPVGGQRRLDLEALLYKSTECLTTDPRDRVFALLSLYQSTANSSQATEERTGSKEGGERTEIRDREGQCEDAQYAITADYSLTPIQVFRKTVLHCIHESGELNILGLAGWFELGEPTCDRIHDDGLSSWVPRWDLPRPIQFYSPAIGSFDSQEENGRVRTRSRLYHYACGAEPMDRQSNADPALLVLRGIQVDKILYCSREYGREEEGHQLYSPLAEIWVTFAVWMKLNSDCTDEEVDELARTVYDALLPWTQKWDEQSAAVLWHSPKDSISRPNMESLLRSSCIAFEHAFIGQRYRELSNRVSDYFDSGLRSYPDSLLLPPKARRHPTKEAVDISYRLHEYLNTRTNAFEWQFTVYTTTKIGRAFFVTEQGRIGIGSSRLREGDELFVLFGGPSLYALRPCRGEHHLAGAAYLKHFARGEAVKEMRKGERQAVWVKIR